MNSVQIVGRFTRDPEIRYTDGGISIARFSLAVDRRFKKDGGQQADFPTCVAFGKTAEFIEKYFHKGQRIGIQGRIQTGKYENNDGATVYTTDIVVETCEFVESKAASSDQNPNVDEDGFMNVPDGIDDEVPFQ